MENENMRTLAAPVGVSSERRRLVVVRNSERSQLGNSLGRHVVTVVAHRSSLIAVSSQLPMEWLRQRCTLDVLSRRMVGLVVSLVSLSSVRCPGSSINVVRCPTEMRSFCASPFSYCCFSVFSRKIWYQ